MFHRKLFSLTAVLALLAGCSGAADPIHVWNSSDEYKTGAVKSPLATPIVDEAPKAEGGSSNDVRRAHGTKGGPVSHWIARPDGRKM